MRWRCAIFDPFILLQIPNIQSAPRYRHRRAWFKPINWISSDYATIGDWRLLVFWLRNLLRLETAWYSVTISQWNQLWTWWDTLDTLLWKWHCRWDAWNHFFWHLVFPVAQPIQLAYKALDDFGQPFQQVEWHLINHFRIDFNNDAWVLLVHIAIQPLGCLSLNSQYYLLPLPLADMTSYFRLHNCGWHLWWTWIFTCTIMIITKLGRLDDLDNTTQRYIQTTYSIDATYSLMELDTFTPLPGTIRLTHGLDDATIGYWMMNTEYATLNY